MVYSKLLEIKCVGKLINAKQECRRRTEQAVSLSHANELCPLVRFLPSHVELRLQRSLRYDCINPSHEVLMTVNLFFSLLDAILVMPNKELGGKTVNFLF